MKKAYDLRSGVKAQSSIGLRYTPRAAETPKDENICQFKRFEESIR
jgi:hypothetical protein